jgi:YVTN family beta-propeller protein
MNIVTYRTGFNPSDLWSDGEGSTWIANTGSNQLVRVGNASLLSVDLAESPLGIVNTSIDRLLVTSPTSGSYTIVSLDGVVEATKAFLDIPGRGVVDSTGSMWIACENGNSVKRLSSIGVVLETKVVGHNPYTIGVVENGDSLEVWTSNTGSSTLTRWMFLKTGGIVTDYALGIVTQFPVPQEPRGMIVDSTGVWVTCGHGLYSNSLVNIVGGDVREYPVGFRPWDVAKDVNGKLWVANYGSNTIVQVDPSGPILQTISVGKKPCRIIIDSSNIIWVACFEDHSVLAISEVI